jgi:hypothetical protein
MLRIPLAAAMDLRAFCWAMETAVNSPADSSRVGRMKHPQRSAIANGKLLPGVDQRSSWVRRCRELIADHTADLGGERNTSSAERSLVRRCAVLTTELERLEVKFALAGEASAEDLHLYQRMTNTLRDGLSTSRAASVKTAKPDCSDEDDPRNPRRPVRPMAWRG